MTKLNAIWQSRRAALLQGGAAPGATPSTRTASTTSTPPTSQRLFGPGGLIDAFTNDQLLPYIDTAARPWRWRADLGLDDGALASLERARRIRDALFPGGAGPVMTFTLEPTDLSPNASARHPQPRRPGAHLLQQRRARPAPMTWPGKDGTGVITLAFRPVERLARGDDQRERRLGLAAHAARRPPAGRPTCPTSSACASPTGGYYADFDLAGEQRRQPLRPADVLEVRVPGPDLKCPAINLPAPRTRVAYALCMGCA